MWNFFKQKDRNFDIVLLSSVLLLASLGLLMVYSTSSVYSLETYGDASHFLKLHSIYLLIGISSMVCLMHIDYRFIRKLVYPVFFIVLLMLVLVLIPGIGVKVSGARRWLDLGIFSFQPSELAKFSIVLYLAHSLAKKQNKIHDFYIGFLSHVIAAGIYILLIFAEPDFGGASIILLLLFIMMFIGNVRLKYLIPLGIVSAMFAVFAVITKSYRMERLMAFLNPWSDPLGAGYQTVQSFIAFGLGGLYGMGLGNSTQKLFFLPQAHTDFIFAIIGEELGFIGVLFVILLFSLILFRSMIIARKAPDLFGCYLVTGFALLITLQAGINMAVSVGLLPTKGITLPFVSYGGTSLICSLSAVGIILNVSSAKRK